MPYMDPREIIESAIQLCSPDYFLDSDEGIYFGLTGSLKLVNQITDAKQRNMAQTIVLGGFIENRAPELYTMMEKDIFRKVRAAAQGEEQKALLKFTQQLEDTTRQHRLKELISTADLRPMKVGDGPTIYLPELEEAGTHQIIPSIHTYVRDNPESNLIGFINNGNENYEDSLEEMIKSGEYIPDITERFLRASLHFSIIEYLREAEGKDLPDFSDVVYFNEVRAAMPKAPYLESAIRMQLKENPEYGHQLDEEYNKLILTSTEQIDRLGENIINQPVIINNNKFVKCNQIGHD